ncbi:MAG: restriction endonuclease subunit S [Nitrospirae bacterium]|nr:restriction endonuclease subunit S [Nitrospirota bacterium]
MIANLKPYAEYRASGTDWLGQVPKHWVVRRMKYLLREKDLRSTGGKEQLLRVSQYTGVTKRLSVNGIDEPDTRAESLVGYKVVQPDELVINIMLAWNGSLGISRYVGIASPAYCVYRFGQEAHPWYFHHLLRSPIYKGRIKAVSTGVVESRLRLYSDDLYRLESLLPPLDEQVTIVRFLNHANRRLDRTIRAKRKVIALLNEQKQAIIHRAVTRGLDLTVPLKPSGIPWLGDIPEHWESRRVKQTSRILRGKFSHRPRNDQSLYDGIYPFIQTGAVAQAKKFIASYTQTLNEKGLAVSKLFPKGTLVMTIAANIGNVAVLTFDACFPDSIVGFVPFKEINQDYLYSVFLCMKPDLLREAPVNTQGNLNVERIGAMGIPLPPIDEQCVIVRYIEETTVPLTAAISRTEREIARLREYRTRLIADVVTGKLDVREAAKKLPAEVEQETLPEGFDEVEGADEMEEIVE